MLAFILSSLISLAPPGAINPSADPGSGLTSSAPQAPVMSTRPIAHRIGGPVIRSLSPFSAVHGTEVIITGKHFTGATGVYFGKGHSAEFKVISAHQISAVVPDDANSARVRVVTPKGRAASPRTFQVLEKDQKSK